MVQGASMSWRCLSFTLVSENLVLLVSSILLFRRSVICLAIAGFLTTSIAR